MGDFRELSAWRKAHQLALIVYAAAGRLPRSERFGLADQMRRAAVSVVSNVAEGAGRGDREFARFVTIARGSLAELRSQLLLARDLAFLTEQDWSGCEAPLEEASRMLAGLSRHLRSPEAKEKGRRPSAGPDPGC